MSSATSSTPAGALIFVTQLIDPDDPGLGFVIPQVKALARRFERVIVIANHVVRVPPHFDAEVISLGKEDGAGRVMRGGRYLTTLRRVARRERVATLLVHMSPRYVTAGAIVTRALGIPSLLWFAHPRDSRQLRRAERLVDAVITTDPRTYPRTTGKVRAIGQAIDVDRFALTPPRSAAPRSLLAIGRTSPSKNYPVLLRALKLAREKGAELTLSIVGPSTTREEQRHRDELAALIHELGLDAIAKLHPGVPHDEIASLLEGATAVVNLMTAGGGDKAAFETMAAARPVVVGPGIFVDLVAGTPLPLACAGDAVSLSERLMRLADASPEELAATGRVLRGRVEDLHSLTSWVDAVAAIAIELHARPRRRRR